MRSRAPTLIPGGQSWEVVWAWAFSLGAGQGYREAVLEQHGVRQAGQRVVIGLELDLGLRALAIRDVDQRAFEQTGVAVVLVEQRRVLEGPDHGAVAAPVAHLVVRDR